VHLQREGLFWPWASEPQPAGSPPLPKRATSISAPCPLRAAFPWRAFPCYILSSPLRCSAITMISFIRSALLYLSEYRKPWRLCLQAFLPTSPPLHQRRKKKPFPSDIRTCSAHFFRLQIEIRCLENFDLLFGYLPECP